MKRMTRRIAALVCTLCLLLVGARAEGMPDFRSMQPLVDLTVAAALTAGDTPESISREGTLSQAFVQNFFRMGQQADAALGITAEVLGDPSKQAEYLSRAFSAKQPGLSSIAAGAEEHAYIGMQIMASAGDDSGSTLTLYGDLYMADGPIDLMTEEQYLQINWLSHRAVAELHRDDQAPGGWMMDAITFEPAVTVEWEGQGDQGTMAEYVNADLGFSVQYPAVFSNVLAEDANGVSGQLKDGSASFYARRRANEQGLSLQECVDETVKQYPGAAAYVNDVSQTGRITSQQVSGFTQVDVVIVTQGWIYEAQLTFAPEMAEEFARYSDYMTNSFMADELGIG